MILTKQNSTARRTYFLLLSEKLLEENGVIVVLGDVSLWVNLIDVSMSKFHHMTIEINFIYPRFLLENVAKSFRDFFSFLFSYM